MAKVLDARARSVVKPGIEVVAQLVESVMLVMKVEVWAKVKSLVVLVVKVEVKALVMVMTTSARVLKVQVGDVGLEASVVVTIVVAMLQLQHYSCSYSVVMLTLELQMLCCGCCLLLS